jgi:hypothetical protein
MKGNKIIATLVVLAMVLSTLVVLNKLNINVIGEAGAATPGVDDFGNATTDLVYSTATTGVAVTINTTGLTGLTVYRLYKPRYNCSTGSTPIKFAWDTDPVVTVDGPLAGFTTDADPTNKAKSLGTVVLDRAGIWILDSDTSHNASDRSTFGAFFWVNTTQAYSIAGPSDFKFGDTDMKTITVTDEGGAVTCLVDLINPTNNTVIHKFASGGTLSFKPNDANISMAGDYTIRAYKDLDLHQAMYEYGDEFGHHSAYGYDNTYGTGFSSSLNTTLFNAGDHWSYSVVGAWDPPEKNATEIIFTVTTGKPNIVLTNTTIYWGFETRIDVNVTDNDGNGLDANKESIKLRHGNTYYDYTDVWINNTGNDGNYSIEIPRMSANWTNIGPLANGTWKVYFANDTNKDGTEEWNNSASFTVKSANPPVQLTIVSPSKKKVDVPAYTSGDNQAPTITIAFDIFGTSISNAEGRAYYGDDDPPEDYKNITISGDILYPVDAAYTGPNGRWTADVTPTKPGGTITIAIDWPGDDNGTASQTIEIVNGTHVTPTVEKFTVGQHYNLTVTVKDMDGDPVKNGQVWLIWEDGNGQFNSTNGTGKAGKGLNGEYTFWINPDDSKYPTTAPQNITVAARLHPTSAFWGYTKVVMARNHNMRVNATPTTAYAGDPTTYDISISLIDGGNPSKTGLTVAIYNSTGALVTGDDAWSKTGSYSITDEEIILSGETFYLYAHNDTHDSEGNNATLLITSYTVVSSPSTLAWKIDQSVNMTFQVTPAGNGTLTIENMSSLPNCSYVDQDMQIDIVNGVGMLDEVNATTLGNVTFAYTPEDGGESRPADGLLRVTTATATPSPTTIYVGEATSVTITITHPATGVALQGVEVGLDIDLNSTTTILSKLPTNKFTDAQGKVTFAITAEASGNVTIFIENETDPDNEFVIIATSRKTMTISADPSVDEGKTFTIEAKSNGVLITDAVTFTFNGQTWPTTTGIATLTAPSVTTSLSYPITATADGYTSASGMIMVLNVPKLMIIPPSGKVSGTQKFVVTIANDAGAGVTGAKVTFNGVDYYSGVNGACELTAPDVKEESANYQITATFTGYTEATPLTMTIYKTPGIPGFELLTLIAAIGVAFLLLRRRRN